MRYVISKDTTRALESSSSDLDDGTDKSANKVFDCIKCTKFLDNEKYRVDSN